MKHLLIIISILLLSSPVIGEETLPVSGNEYLRCLSSSQENWAKKFRTGEEWSEEDVICEEPEIGEETLPVSGGKGVTLYEWETSSGKVWKYFGDNKIHTKYEGEVENGVPNGLGVMTYPSGRQDVGSWKDGGWLNGTQYTKDGMIINGIIYNKDRKIIWKVVNGKWIKQ